MHPNIGCRAQRAPPLPAVLNNNFPVKKTKQLLHYLDLAMDPKVGLDSEAAVDNFAAELLRGLECHTFSQLWGDLGRPD